MAERKKLSSVQVAQTGYALGKYDEYRSIYGYPKRIIKVHHVTSPGQPISSAQVVGGIKEERIFDETGNVVGTCFYEKNGWRRSGTVRFFATPEALLIACGKTPVVGLPLEPQEEAHERAVELSQVKPIDQVPQLPVTHPLLLLAAPTKVLTSAGVTRKPRRKPAAKKAKSSRKKKARGWKPSKQPKRKVKKSF